MPNPTKQALSTIGTPNQGVKPTLSSTKSHRNLGVNRITEARIISGENEFMGARNSIGAPRMAAADPKELMMNNRGANQLSTFDSRVSVEQPLDQSISSKRATPHDLNIMADSLDYSGGMTP